MTISRDDGVAAASFRNAVSIDEVMKSFPIINVLL